MTEEFAEKLARLLLEQAGLLPSSVDDLVFDEDDDFIANGEEVNL